MFPQNKRNDFLKREEVSTKALDAKVEGSLLVAALCCPQSIHTHPSSTHGWRQSANGEWLT